MTYPSVPYLFLRQAKPRRNIISQHHKKMSFRDVMRDQVLIKAPMDDQRLLTPRQPVYICAKIP